MEKENEIPLEFKKMVEIEKKKVESENKILFIGIKGKEKTIIVENKMVDIFDLMYERNFLQEKYFNFLEQRAISHILSPTAYEKTMWRESCNGKPLTQAETLNEESVFMFGCWIEDKYKPGEMAILISKYSIFDHLYIYYFSVEDGEENEGKENVYKRKPKREEILQ